MTEREEIDLLRRAVADLTERVRVLEARHRTPNTHIGITPHVYHITPMRDPIYGPAGDPPSTGRPMPQHFPATCAARTDGGPFWQESIA